MCNSEALCRLDAHSLTAFDQVQKQQKHPPLCGVPASETLMPCYTDRVLRIVLYYTVVCVCVCDSIRFGRTTTGPRKVKPCYADVHCLKKTVHKKRHEERVKR